MEKKSCCCAGEAETVNINMETTGVTGVEAAANTVTAETEIPSDDAVCHCRHKHRTEKEEKDLLTRLNRIERSVASKLWFRTNATARISWFRYLPSSPP